MGKALDSAALLAVAIKTNGRICKGLAASDQAIAAAVTAVILPQTPASPGLDPGGPPTVPVRSVDAVPRPRKGTGPRRQQRCKQVRGLQPWLSRRAGSEIAGDAEMTICSVDTRGGQKPLEVQSPVRHEAERLGVAAHALPAACPLVWADCGRQRCFRTRGEEAHKMTGHTSRLSSWSSRFYRKGGRWLLDNVEHVRGESP